MLDRQIWRERETKKRKPAIRLPDALVAHMRRWRRNQLFAVEWNGKPVERIDKALAWPWPMLGSATT